MESNFTKLGTLFLGVMLAQGVQAQSFQPTFPFTNLKALHRCTPATGDINNDGKIDIYQGGENWESGMSWQVQGYLWLNQGGGAFTGYVSNIYTDDHYTDDTKTTVASPAGMDANGNYLAFGLPPSVYNMSRFFDYDNDGNLDFFIDGESDNDYQLTKHPGNKYAMLYRNTGSANGFKYVLATDDTFMAGGNEHRGNNAENNHSIAFADYDRDGYVDVLQQAYHKWYDENGDEQGQREVALFHNNGDGTFTKVNVFNPLPYDSNPHADGGIFEVDEETFENVAKKNILPMTHGAVAFGDLNNDGYPDIITTGFCDGSNGGAAIAIYKNNGDGTFDELDLSGRPFRGIYESDLVLADVNGDGWLDILAFGTANNMDGKIGDIYYNNGATTPFDFTLSSVDSGNGLYGLSAANVAVFDINHDGLPDVVGHGWTNVDGKGWGTYVFLQNNDQTFTLDSQMLDCTDSGGWNFGDLTGNNQMDIVMTGYLNNNDNWNCYTILYTNTNSGNTPPTAPQNVQAKCEDGKLTVTWDPASDDQASESSLAYNVFVRNNDTGYISMIVPADTETGKLKAYSQIADAVHSDNEYSYTVKVPASGNYTVGVQAIDPSLVGGKFATTDLTVTTGIRNAVNADNSMQAEILESGIRVKANDTQAVNIYNVAGTLIATGTTNSVIPVSASGVFLVKANGKTWKVVK